MPKRLDPPPDPHRIPLFKRYDDQLIASETNYGETTIFMFRRGYRPITAPFMDAVTIAFPNDEDLFTETTERTEE